MKWIWKPCFFFATTWISFASTITYSTGGTFNSSQTVDAPYFFPNTSWSLTFNVQNPPVVNFSFPGPPYSYFQTDYTNGLFTVGGTQITLTGYEVYFYSDQMLDICLDSACNNQIGIGQSSIYTGDVTSPTLSTGVFAASDATASYYIRTQDLPVQNDNGPVTVTATSNAATTPEPTSSAMTGAALLALSLLLRRRYLWRGL